MSSTKRRTICSCSGSADFVNAGYTSKTNVSCSSMSRRAWGPIAGLKLSRAVLSSSSHCCAVFPGGLDEASAAGLANGGKVTLEDKFRACETRIKEMIHSIEVAGKVEDDAGHYESATRKTWVAVKVVSIGSRKINGPL